MKLILLAAAAVIAVPAIAQTTPATPPADQTMPAGDPAATTTDPSTPDQNAPAPMGAPTQQAPMAGTTGDPVGGYQPNASPLSGGTAGAQSVFRPAPSPDQAYPAPAPRASYPVCKRGQYDKCRNPGGK